MTTPLVPADVDLRDFEFMPLQVARLRDSDLAIKATGEEFRAAVLLWCASWHQVPAASLPNDDAALARFAGYGRTELDAWRAVREGALRGFVLCDDDRLYHPTVAEKAMESWLSKLQHRFRRECDRLKKAAQRAQSEFVAPTFEDWRAHVERTGQDRYEDVPNLSLGHAKGHSKDVHKKSALKGQGEGQCKGQGQGEEKKEKPRAATASPSESPEWAAFWAAYPSSKGRKAALKAWGRLSPDAALVARIMAAVEAQARSQDWLKDGGQFVPHAATWLNGERWTDSESGKPAPQLFAVNGSHGNGTAPYERAPLPEFRGSRR